MHVAAMECAKGSHFFLNFLIVGFWGLWIAMTWMGLFGVVGKKKRDLL